MKYFVIATVYDSDKCERAKEIVGEFKDFNMASLFQMVYNNRYKSDAVVRSEGYILEFGA